ncbi:uncharacterized protein SPSK_00173 [Sporothrix schenckii 1099-18]|uniref:DUF7053 domain-containing protein n=2 Tax=Sporothrix schenckii TaxID=29908 RepID=U7PLE2_SPOS1|nr:uncharacterized protein SPSK_00173 [Sporothrix schenckii 1099-18]ERS95756.1 hypothetical protein HMPREF1624_07831 [Sporothrix schenckii ATCC 58251]KJR83773.1 hypothetical protein SPSK_00173 [Sporothrix schenckii 1099-18]
MSFFNTTATLRHTSQLPAGTDKTTAVKAMLQDHRAFIQCGPHSVDCATVADDEAAQLAETALASHAKSEHPLPEDVRAVLESSPREKDGRRFGVYRVTDVVQTLPAGLWDSKVVSTYEMTDMPSGVFVRIRSPMSIVMDTTWTVAETEGGGDASDSASETKLVLVEEIVIYCSRLLVGTVKGLCEGGWQQIHGNMMKRLAEGDAAEMGKQ